MMLEVSLERSQAFFVAKGLSPSNFFCTFSREDLNNWIQRIRIHAILHAQRFFELNPTYQELFKEGLTA